MTPKWQVGALLVLGCVAGSCGGDTADAPGGEPADSSASDDTDAGSSDAVDAVDAGPVDVVPGTCGATPLPFTFAREDFASVEDCIAPSVCLARDADGPIYNSAREEEAERTGCLSASPVGTEWALGECLGNPGPFASLRSAHECRPMTEIAGEEFCLHVIGEDLWYDVEFISFSSGGPGGGFAYRRTLRGGDPCGVGAECQPADGGVVCVCPGGTGGDPGSFCN